MMEHDIGGLRGLARRVADVETFDPHKGEIGPVLPEPQRLDEGARARLVRALFCEQAGERELGVTLGHVEPGAALALRLVDDLDAMPTLHLEQFDQRRRLQVPVDDDRARHEALDIVLHEKRLEHLLLERALGDAAGEIDVGREIGAIPEVPPAAHHCKVDARLAAFDANRDDVGVGVACDLDALLLQDARERAQLVANRSRLLVTLFLGADRHGGLEVSHHRTALPAQETLGVRDIPAVVHL